MKKSWIGVIAVLLVGGVSTVGATTIDVVTVGLGDMGHAGTAEDPLVAGEMIDVALVLNHVPIPSYPSYDNPILMDMDLDLHIGGAGSLDSSQEIIKGALNFQWHPDLMGSPIDMLPYIGTNDVPLTAVSVNGVPGQPGGVELVGGFAVKADGTGDIPVTLALGEVWVPCYWPGPPLPDWPEWLSQEDLGDLMIYAPEPVTMCLLSAGAFTLLRKRRR